MTNEEAESLKRFQTRVRQLMLSYGELKKQTEACARRIEELERENERLRGLESQARQEYANLKVAKMMAINDGDVKDAKARLSRLIHEIDKCIALLNV